MPQHVLATHTLPMHPLTHAIAHKNADIAQKSTTRDLLSEKPLVEKFYTMVNVNCQSSSLIYLVTCKHYMFNMWDKQSNGYSLGSRVISLTSKTKISPQSHNTTTNALLIQDVHKKSGRLTVRTDRTRQRRMLMDAPPGIGSSSWSQSYGLMTSC